MDNTLNKQPISRDEIKFPYALPSTIPNTYGCNKPIFIDRHIESTRLNKPVQIQMHDNISGNYSMDKVNMYQFENYNQETDINKYMEYKSIDTRQQFYNNREDTYKQFNPQSTRINDKTQNRGIDINLLPTKLQNVPTSNV